MYESGGHHKWLALAAVNLGNFVPPLDTGIMSLILPTVSISMKAPISVVLWVPLTSLLVEAAFMPIFGRFSDSRGRRRFFLVGLALFAAGSFLAGNSLTIFELLLYRVIQSLGAAFILANGRALIVDNFRPEERGFALGTHVSTIYVGMTIGTAVTGSIVSVTQLVGWRYVLYVSGLIAAVAIPLSFLALSESPKNKGRTLDWLGALLFVSALGLTLITTSESVQSGFGRLDIFIEYIRIPILNFYLYTNTLISIPILLIAAGALISFALFVLRELTTKQPLIDFGLFRRNTVFASTNISALLIYLAHHSTLILLSFYFQVVKGLDPLSSALILTVEPLSVTFFAVLGGWISDRTGSRDASVAGLAITSVSLLLLSTIGLGSSVTFVAFLLGMLGAGVGLFAPNNTNANLSSVPPGDRALANGILGMMRHTGQSLSLALGTLLVGYYVFGQSPSLGGTFDLEQYVRALNLNFIIGAVISAAGALATLRGRESIHPTGRLA